MRHAEVASDRSSIDTRDILVELGAGGWEDMIVGAALDLVKARNSW